MLSRKQVPNPWLQLVSVPCTIKKYFRFWKPINTFRPLPCIKALEAARGGRQGFCLLRPYFFPNRSDISLSCPSFTTKKIVGGSELVETPGFPVCLSSWRSSIFHLCLCTGTPLCCCSPFIGRSTLLRIFFIFYDRAAFSCAGLTETTYWLEVSFFSWVSNIRVNCNYERNYFFIEVNSCTQIIQYYIDCPKK